jgi:predicted DsbA family dithiol-disulfide isomerase
VSGALVKVEIWSDVVCPWCYVGKRRFEAALDRFAHRDDVDVIWRSFELDPSAPQLRTDNLTEHLAAKYDVTVADAQAMQDRMTAAAAAEGLTFHFDQARSGNTFDAHRLLHFAADLNRQGALEETLLRAYFTDGAAIGDRLTLVRLAVDAGLDGDEATATLHSAAYADAVRSDEREAAALGIRAVPFFVVDRTYGVSGAQSPDVVLEVLQQAWVNSRSLTSVGVSGAHDCSDGSCTG